MTNGKMCPKCSILFQSLELDENSLIIFFALNHFLFSKLPVMCYLYFNTEKCIIKKEA